MLLTDDERNKFADYLEREAKSNEALAKRIESSAGMIGVTRSLVKRKRTLAMSQMIVAKELRSGESFSIG